MEAFVEGLAPLEKSRLLVELILRHFEGTDWMLNHMRAALCPPTVRIVFTSDSVDFVQLVEGKESRRVSVSGANGAWLKWLLVRRVEGKRSLALWAAAFHRSPRIRERCNAMADEIRRSVASMFPTLGLRVLAGGRPLKVAVQHTDVPVSQYEIEWDDSAVKLQGAVLRAAQSCSLAKNARADGEWEDFLAAIQAAINACPEAITPYELLLDELRTNPKLLTDAAASPDLIKTIQAGLVTCEHYIHSVMAGFADTNVPAYLPAIHQWCFTEAEVSLHAVSSLSDMLDCPNLASMTGGLNPLNRLLKCFRSKATRSREDAERMMAEEACRSLLRDTVQSVISDDRYTLIEDDFRETEREGQLYSALHDIVDARPMQWFPEPSIDDSWRDDTVRTWAEALFAMILAHEKSVGDISLDDARNQFRNLPDRNQADDVSDDQEAESDDPEEELLR